MFKPKKSVEELYLITLKINAKFDGELTCDFSNDMKNLANFCLQAKK